MPIEEDPKKIEEVIKEKFETPHYTDADLNQCKKLIVSLVQRRSSPVDFLEVMMEIEKVGLATLGDYAFTTRRLQQMKIVLWSGMSHLLFEALWQVLESKEIILVLGTDYYYREKGFNNPMPIAEVVQEYDTWHWYPSYLGIVGKHSELIGLQTHDI